MALSFLLPHNAPNTSLSLSITMDACCRFAELLVVGSCMNLLICTIECQQKARSLAKLLFESDLVTVIDLELSSYLSEEGGGDGARS